MNKFFTWTVLCAVSIQYSYSKLTADTTVSLPQITQNQSPQRPSPTELQKEVESISLQNFFLTPKSSNTPIQPFPTEEITTASSESVEAVLDSSTNTTNSASAQQPLQGDMPTELILETPGILTRDTQSLVIETEQTTVFAEISPVIVSQETNSSDSLDVATSTEEHNPLIENPIANIYSDSTPQPAPHEPSLEVSTQSAPFPTTMEADRSLESLVPHQETNSSAPLDVATSTEEHNPLIEHPADIYSDSNPQQAPHEPSLEVSTQSAPFPTTMGADRSLEPLVPHEETNSSDSLDVATSTEEQNSIPDRLEVDVQASLVTEMTHTNCTNPILPLEEPSTSCWLLESDTSYEETSSSKPEASTLNNSTELPNWEFIGTKDINDTPESCPTSQENPIETKSHKTLFSKIVIGTVGTAVILLSIVLGSK